MASFPLLRISSQNVLLSEAQELQPAVITLDVSTGKIVDIKTDGIDQAMKGDIPVIDVESNFVLPGVVE